VTVNPALPIVQQPESKNTGRSTRGWSYYGKWSECHRAWAFDNLYPPAKNTPTHARGASLGTFVHALMARHYLIEMGVPQPTVDEVVEANREGMSDEDVRLGLSRYREYVANFSTDDWTPVQVEEELMIGIVRDRPLGTGPRSVRVVPAHSPGSVLYTSRLDLVVIDATGRIWIVDHKTAARVYPGSGKDYSMSGQVHGFYHLGRAHFGEQFAGVIINFIQTHAGTKFVRKEPFAAPQMVQDHPWNVVVKASEIQQTVRMVEDRGRAEGRAPDGWDFDTASSPMICVSKWGECPFLLPCRFGRP